MIGGQRHGAPAPARHSRGSGELWLLHFGRARIGSTAALAVTAGGIFALTEIAWSWPSELKTLAWLYVSVNAVDCESLPGAGSGLVVSVEPEHGLTDVLRCDGLGIPITTVAEDHECLLEVGEGRIELPEHPEIHAEVSQRPCFSRLT
jgi:hypothetical protein